MEAWHNVIMLKSRLPTVLFVPIVCIVTMNKVSINIVENIGENKKNRNEKGGGEEERLKVKRIVG